MDTTTVMVFGNLLALSAELEAMKSANIIASFRHMPLPYDEKDFYKKADEIRNATNELFK